MGIRDSKGLKQVEKKYIKREATVCFRRSDVSVITCPNDANRPPNTTLSQPIIQTHQRPHHPKQIKSNILPPFHATIRRRTPRSRPLISHLPPTLPILTPLPPFLPPLLHCPPYSLTNFIQALLTTNRTKPPDRKPRTPRQPAARAAPAAAPARRARREEADVTEVVERFVAGEVAGGGGAGGDAGLRVRASGGGVRVEAAGWCARMPGGFGGFGFLLVSATAERVGDDADVVKVREHFRAEGVDDFGDLAGERGAGFAELVEGVGGGGIERKDERAQ